MNNNYMYKLLIILMVFSCNTQKGVPNYKVTPEGYVIWRYSKTGEPKKDILSNGDTLVSYKDSIYIIPKNIYL